MGRWDGWMRLWSRIGGRGREREVEQELSFHLESRIQEYQARGLTRQEAVRRSRERFGDVERVRRELRSGVEGRVRRQSAVDRVTGLVQDVRVTLRQLGKRPTYTLIAIVTLTLGIGTNTAIFTLVNGYFLAPLPYEAPERIVAIWEVQPDGNEMTVSPVNFFAWKDEAPTFADAAAFNIAGPTVTGDGDPERIVGSVVTTDFFEVLGVSPLRGPGFAPGHGEAGREAVVLSHGFWQRRYAGDPSVVGRTIQLDGTPHVVVGVMAPDFKHPEHSPGFQDPEVWLAMSLEERRESGSHYLRVLARMAPGISFEQASAEAAALGLRVEERYPDAHRGWGTVVRPLSDELFGASRPALLMLLGAGTLILLIVCANMANLVLARTQDRSREFAMRAALGAGRARLARSVLLEALVVTVAGGALGTTLVWLGRDAIESVQARYLTQLVDVRVDGAVLLLTLGAALVTVLIFGLVPALRSSRPDIRSHLVEGATGAGMSRGAARARSLLVTGEVALTATLLVAAGLLIRSLLALASVPPGFQVSDMLIFRLSTPSERYETREEVKSFYDRMEEELGALPGVTGMASVSDLLFTTENVWTTYAVEGREHGQGDSPRSEIKSVDPEYFRVLGIPVVAGRGFTGGEDPEAPAEVVVNRALADAAFPGQNPLGGRLEIHNGGVGVATVIGVVGDVLDDGLAGRVEPLFYLPFSHVPSRRRYMLVQTSVAPASLAAQVRSVVTRVDPLLPVSELQTLEELVARSAAPSRMASRLAMALAALALTLAAVGIYGVLAHLVGSRTREMGIRAALGAARADVMRLVMSHSLKVTAVGLALGLGGAVLAGRVLQGILFGVAPLDALSFLGAGTVLLATAIVATWLPARRASRVDPVVALKAE